MAHKPLGLCEVAHRTVNRACGIALLFTRNAFGRLLPLRRALGITVGESTFGIWTRMQASVQLSTTFCMATWIAGRIVGASQPAHIFPDERLYAYRPCQSVNYVASRDGLTMNDLVSFTDKNNWANGHGNQDGHGDYSSNNGWESELGAAPEVVQQRKRQVKHLFCLLLLSNAH